MYLPDQSHFKEWVNLVNELDEKKQNFIPADNYSALLNEKYSFLEDDKHYIIKDNYSLAYVTLEKDVITEKTTATTNNLVNYEIEKEYFNFFVTGSLFPEKFNIKSMSEFFEKYNKDYFISNLKPQFFEVFKDKKLNFYINCEYAIKTGHLYNMINLLLKYWFLNSTIEVSGVSVKISNLINLQDWFFNIFGVFCKKNNKTFLIVEPTREESAAGQAKISFDYLPNSKQIKQFEYLDKKEIINLTDADLKKIISNLKSFLN